MAAMTAHHAEFANTLGVASENQEEQSSADES
jgi:hypothetical protein